MKKPTKPVPVSQPFQDVASFDPKSIQPTGGNPPANRPSANPQIARAVSEAVSTWLENLPQDDFTPQGKAECSCGNDSTPEDPNLLPKTIEILPQAGETRILWNKIEQLPGYMVSGIRKMGRDIFRSFPCFQNFSEECSKKGQDPLAEVYVASDLTHNQSAVNYLAKTISEKGQLINAGEMEHTGIPGYKPRIVLYMTEDMTFKLVQDRPEFGAPISANYIYAWPGGTNFYRKQALGAPVPELLSCKNE